MKNLLYSGCDGPCSDRPLARVGQTDIRFTLRLENPRLGRAFSCWRLSRVIFAEEGD